MSALTTEEKLRRQFPDLEFTKLPNAAVHPHFRYPGFKPGVVTTLPKGYQKSLERAAFSTDVVYEQDVAIPMRDGIKLYADIFRPADSGVRVSALIPWSPYGKTGTGPQQYGLMGPFNCGVAPERTSGFEKFEAPDPAEWCGRGYAIINVDARGAGMSEGNIAFWGDQEAEDIHDTIDWLAVQPWCSGSVAMVGNSWLGIAQINFASRLTHPALKALAPLEAMHDPYRQLIARGGKPHNTAFHKLLISGFAGPNAVENMPAMLFKRPLYDEYWKSKYIVTENIDVPLYLTASYSSMLHTEGSFHTYRSAKTRKKWLRVHPYQEWFDLYRADINDDLQKFFDRYCNNVDNDWESTPPVRLSLLGFNGSPAKTILERPETQYPLARQHLEKYYLDASNCSLVPAPPTSTASVSYESHHLTASKDFTLTFDKYTEIAGYASVRLHMSCAEHDDMDVCVQIRKIDAKGKPLEQLNYPCPVSDPYTEVPNVNVAKTLGPQGFLRASHAVSRITRDGDDEIFYAHKWREPITPRGRIVPLDIALWPMGMVFEPGDGIMLRISGHDMSYPEVEMVRLTEPDDENVGNHVVWTGGEKYDSYLVIPVVSD